MCTKINTAFRVVSPMQKLERNINTVSRTTQFCYLSGTILEVACRIMAIKGLVLIFCNSRWLCHRWNINCSFSVFESLYGQNWSKPLITMASHKREHYVLVINGGQKDSLKRSKPIYARCCFLLHMLRSDVFQLLDNNRFCLKY